MSDIGMLTQSEENYLKSIFHLSNNSSQSQVSTNEIAEDLKTKASSVTEMIKKLSEKNLINYQKYKGSSLTEVGSAQAIKIIRKHRLWETFLVEKLQFRWDEVHEIAEQLEHINSEKLTNKLNQFLNHPKFDPHGDPIPNGAGEFPISEPLKKLKDMEVGEGGIVGKIGSDKNDFLLYLTKNKIELGAEIICKDKFEFDGSIVVSINDRAEISLSKKVIKYIYIK